MKLLDLFETDFLITLAENTGSVQLQATDRFQKEAKEFARAYPNFKSNLEKFLTAKIQTPRAPINKRDNPGGFSKDNWGTAHIIFGKAIIWYKIIGDTLILASVSDHKPLDAIGTTVASSLKNFLSTVDLNKTKTIDINFLDKKSAAPDTISSKSNEVEPSQKYDVKEFWIYNFKKMAERFGDRQIIENLANGFKTPQDKSDYMIFLDVLGMNYTQVPFSEQQALAQQALEQVQPPVEDLKYLFNEGIPVADIAKYFNTTELTITDALDKYYPDRATIKVTWDDEKTKKLRQLYDQGMLLQDIAKEFDLSLDNINFKLKLYYPERSRRKGAKAIDSAQMALQYASGQKMSEIAAEYNVSIPTVIQRVKAALKRMGQTQGSLRNAHEMNRKTFLAKQKAR